MNHPVETQHKNPFALDLPEGPNKFLSTEINHMIQGGSWSDRLRLRKLRSHENAQYAAATLKEMMAAKRRTIVGAIGLTEDYAQKLLLKEAAFHTEAVEQDITRFTTEAIRYFESEATDKIEAAYVATEEKMARAEALFNAQKLSKRRYDALVARIDREAENIAHGVETMIKKLLSNLGQRFDKMLQLGGKA